MRLPRKTLISQPKRLKWSPRRLQSTKSLKKAIEFNLMKKIAKRTQRMCMSSKQSL